MPLVPWSISANYAVTQPKIGNILQRLASVRVPRPWRLSCTAEVGGPLCRADAPSIVIPLPLLLRTPPKGARGPASPSGAEEDRNSPKRCRTGPSRTPATMRLCDRARQGRRCRPSDWMIWSLVLRNGR